MALGNFSEVLNYVVKNLLVKRYVLITLQGSRLPHDRQGRWGLLLIHAQWAFPNELVHSSRLTNRKLIAKRLVW